MIHFCGRVMSNVSRTSESRAVEQVPIRRRLDFRRDNSSVGNAREQLSGSNPDVEETNHQSTPYPVAWRIYGLNIARIEVMRRLCNNRRLSFAR